MVNETQIAASEDSLGWKTEMIILAGGLENVRFPWFDFQQWK